MIEIFLEILARVSTFVVAIATVVLAVFTYRLTRESEISREEAKRPRLCAKLKPSPNRADFICVVIGNVGRGVGLNVEFYLEGDEKDFQAHHMTPLRGTGSPINFMAAGDSQSYPLGSIDNLITTSSETRLEAFSVKMKYEDVDGNRYEESCPMDVRQFDALVWEMGRA